MNMWNSDKKKYDKYRESEILWRSKYFLKNMHVLANSESIYVSPDHLNIDKQPGKKEHTKQAISNIVYKISHDLFEFLAADFTIEHVISYGWHLEELGHPKILQVTGNSENDDIRKEQDIRQIVGRKNEDIRKNTRW